jgi:hypothetical protein
VGTNWNAESCAVLQAYLSRQFFLTLSQICTHQQTTRLDASSSITGYLRSYSHRRKLQVYLVGRFPIEGVTTDILDRMIKFTITIASSKCRTFRDKTQLKKMKSHIISHNLRTDATFIMSFGISTQIGSLNNRPYWHKIDDIPDRTVDLRVYNPTLYNRLKEEVRLSWRVSMRLSGGLLRRGRHITALMGFFHACRNDYALADFAYLTAPKLICRARNL